MSETNVYDEDEKKELDSITDNLVKFFKEKNYTSSEEEPERPYHIWDYITMHNRFVKRNGVKQSPLQDFKVQHKDEFNKLRNFDKRVYPLERLLNEFFIPEELRFNEEMTEDELKTIKEKRKVSPECAAIDTALAMLQGQLEYSLEKRKSINKKEYGAALDTLKKHRCSVLGIENVGELYSENLPKDRDMGADVRKTTKLYVGNMNNLKKRVENSTIENLDLPENLMEQYSENLKEWHFLPENYFINFESFDEEFDEEFDEDSDELKSELEKIFESEKTDEIDKLYNQKKYLDVREFFVNADLDLSEKDYKNFELSEEDYDEKFKGFIEETNNLIKKLKEKNLNEEFNEDYIQEEFLNYLFKTYEPKVPKNIVPTQIGFGYNHLLQQEDFPDDKGKGIGYYLLKGLAWSMGAIAAMLLAGGTCYLLHNALKKDSRYPIGYSYFPEDLTAIIKTYGTGYSNYMIAYKEEKTEEGWKKVEMHVAFPKVLSVRDEKIYEGVGGNGTIYLDIDNKCQPYINLSFIRAVMKDCKKVTDDIYVDGLEFREFLDKKLDTGIYLKVLKNENLKVPVDYSLTIENCFDKFIVCDEKDGKYFSLYFKDKNGQEKQMNFGTSEQGESRLYNMIDLALNAMKRVYEKDAIVTSDQIFAVYEQISKNDVLFVDSAILSQLRNESFKKEIQNSLKIGK